MGLKIGQNINFWPFLGFSSVFGRDTASWPRHSFFRLRPSFLVVTVFGRDIVFGVATKFPGRDSLLGCDSFWTATCFSSPTCRGHNFFVLTRIWACEYSLERSLNVECNHEEL